MFFFLDMFIINHWLFKKRNQTSVFNGKFDSFKKISHQMGPPYSEIQLASTFEIESNEWVIYINDKTLI